MSDFTVAIDTETTGLYLKHGCRGFMVTATTSDRENFLWEWPVDPYNRTVAYNPKDIKEITDLANSGTIVFHHAKFDMRVLKLSGVKLPQPKFIHDTLLMSHIYDSAEPHGLKDLAAKYLDYPKSDETELKKAVDHARRIGKKYGYAIASADHPSLKPAGIKGPKAGWGVCDYWLPAAIARYEDRILKPHTTPEEREHFRKVCATYAVGDTERTLLLYWFYKEVLETDGLWQQYIVHKKNIKTAIRMEDWGVPVKIDLVEEKLVTLRELSSRKMQAAIDIAEKHTEGEFNPNSPKQLSELLYDKWKLPVIKTTDTGNPSCDADTLLRLAFKLDSKTIGKKSYRRDFLTSLLYGKKIGKTVEALERLERNIINNRVYPSVNLTGTSTVRVSYENPNTQNITKGGATSGIEDADLQEFLNKLGADNITLRSVFGPDGTRNRIWYSIDYSQLQLRIFAYVSGEKSLIKAFEEGWDAHDYIASRIFKVDKPSKLQRRIGKNVNFGFIFGASPAKIEATAGRAGLWDEVTGMFPTAHKFMQTTIRQVRKNGCVYTPGGYRLTCLEAHKGVNYIVQGSEGEIVKRAMTGCYDYLSTTPSNKIPDPSYLCLQVHDELVFDMAYRGKIPPKKLVVDYIDEEGKKKQKAKRGAFPHVNELCRIMEAAGSHYGMITPVDPELILDSWDHGAKLVA